MTPYSDAFAAALNLFKEPFPPDVAARLEALEKQITDDRELDRIGDLWEALIAAGVDVNRCSDASHSQHPQT